MRLMDVLDAVRKAFLRFTSDSNLSAEVIPLFFARILSQNTHGDGFATHQGEVAELYLRHQGRNISAHSSSFPGEECHIPINAEENA